MSRSRTLALAALPLLTLAGCGTLSGSGPSAATLSKAPEVDVVDVTPEAATAARTAALAADRQQLDDALARLRAGAGDTAARLAPGDMVEVTLWSFSPWPGGGGAALGSAAPGPIALGSFTLGEDGAVTLPYAGRAPLAGLAPAQAEQAIASRYASLRLLQRPTAVVKRGASPRSDVLVTGAIGQPRSIPWTPAGMTLAQAITQSLGDGGAVLGQGDLAGNKAAVRVAVLRGDGAPIELPVAAALEERIALAPGDRVIVRKAPVVEVTVLGGGARRDGVIGFAKSPTLAEALAEANGLDGNVANDHAVFVMRRRDGARPTLYDFAWKRGDGLVAAQQFPLESGDLVYVAEAPIVPVQRVIGLLFQVSLPAQALK